MTAIYGTFDDPPTAYPDFTSNVQTVLADDDNRLYRFDAIHIKTSTNNPIDIMNNKRIRWIGISELGRLRHSRSTTIFQNTLVMISSASSLDSPSTLKIYFS